VLGTAAMMVWCGLTTVGVGVSDIEKRCNAHRMSGNAFCIFGVGRYTCIFGCTDEQRQNRWACWHASASIWMHPMA
jgi:hypothetical protein